MSSTAVRAVSAAPRAHGGRPSAHGPGLLDTTTSTSRACSVGGGSASRSGPAMSVIGAAPRSATVTLASPHYAGAVSSTPVEPSMLPEEGSMGGESSSDTPMEELMRLVDAEPSLKAPIRERLRSELLKLRRPVSKQPSMRRTNQSRSTSSKSVRISQQRTCRRLSLGWRRPPPTPAA